MDFEKSLRGMQDIDFARYLERNSVTPTHEDIPTLACAVDARPMDAGVAQMVSPNYHQSDHSGGVMFYSDAVRQMDGEPEPVYRTPMGESSAK